MVTLLRMLALALVVGVASIAHADISPPPPPTLRVVRVVAGEGSSAAPSEVVRVVNAARDALRLGLHRMNECMLDHEWRWDGGPPARAQLRLTWDGGPTPSEASIVSSTFSRALTPCITAVLSRLTVSPAPVGRVLVGATLLREPR
jgi:hypothetical protein